MFGVGWYVVVSISRWGVELSLWPSEPSTLFPMKTLILFALELAPERSKAGADDGRLGARWDCRLMGFDLGRGGGVSSASSAANTDIAACKSGQKRVFVSWMRSTVKVKPTWRASAQSINRLKVCAESCPSPIEDCTIESISFLQYRKTDQHLDFVSSWDAYKAVEYPALYPCYNGAGQVQCHISFLFARWCHKGLGTGWISHLCNS